MRRVFGATTSAGTAYRVDTGLFQVSYVSLMLMLRRCCRWLPANHRRPACVVAAQHQLMRWRLVSLGRKSFKLANAAADALW